MRVKQGEWMTDYRKHEDFYCPGDLSSTSNEDRHEGFVVPPDVALLSSGGLLNSLDKPALDMAFNIDGRSS